MHELLLLIASAITTQEGYFIPETIPCKLNNPGDLRASSLPRPKVNGFVQFQSVQEGIAALVVQLCLYALRGHTLRTAIAIYAPPNENNTSVYLENVLSWTGLDADTKLWTYLTIRNMSHA